MALSFAAQALLLSALLAIPIISPDTIGGWERRLVVLVGPPPPVNQAPQPVSRRLELKPPPEIVHLAETPHTLRAPKIEPPRIQPAEAPKFPNLPSIDRQRGGRLTPPIQTNVFSSGSSAPQTLDLPPAKVQTGGFGDPNGVPANPNGSGRPNIAAVGSFDLPQGQGYGNGTGGNQGARGVVASAGFGNGVAVPGDGGGGRGRGVVQPGGFGNATETIPTASRRPEEPPKPVSTPIEVLWKPKPVYTEEARRLRIEGEVVLQVTFTASGQVHVLQVVSGLGHGLDEAAVQAAGQIRFKPAERDGKPIDSTATIRIVFQLA